MRLALKFAYLGGPFHGYQRQPDVRTVEGDILEAMRRLGIAGDPQESRFQSASRTDAGVSALGNVLAVDTTFRPRGICRALNSQLTDIWFWASAPVEETFNPRHALERWYRYHLPPGLKAAALRRCARLFKGRHDFRAFSRSPGPAIQEINSVSLCSVGDGLAVDLHAPSFRWNMVRRIIAAMEAYAGGVKSLAEIREGLRGGRFAIGTAPPEPLVLMDVLYTQVFNVGLGGTPVRRLGYRSAVSSAEGAILRALANRGTKTLP